MATNIDDTKVIDTTEETTTPTTGGEVSTDVTQEVDTTSSPSIVDGERVVIKVVRKHPESKLPTRGTSLSAGLDLYSCVDDLVLSPGERSLVNVGISVQIPEGYYGRIAPRSGLAVTFGVNILAGVIDADYRGILSVHLINHGKDAFIIHKGDRIAQLICTKICIPDVLDVYEHDLSETERGVGGFGSTGK